MTDDSWRDGYDEWKLRAPDWDDDDPEDECDHEGFEINWEGRAQCAQCGQEWWAYPNEIRAKRESQVEYDRWCRQQERREFWRWLTYPIRWPLFWVLERIWPKKACSVLHDDEIPF